MLCEVMSVHASHTLQSMSSGDNVYDCMWWSVTMLSSQSLQVAIIPENGEDVCRRAADVLGYPLDTVFQLSIPEGSQASLAAPFTSKQHYLAP